jgi:hypothetical protein
MGLCGSDKYRHHNGDVGPLNTFRSPFLDHRRNNGLWARQIFWIRRIWGSTVRDLNGKTIAESSEVGFDRIVGNWKRLMEQLQSNTSYR